MPRRGRASPIESVDLKVRLTVDRAAALEIKQSIPEATVKGGTCELRIEGKDPTDVAEKAHVVLEKLRRILETPKGLK